MDLKELFVCIADLGLTHSAKKKQNSHTGTVGYIAPEIFLEKPFTFAADIFSLGVLFFNLLTNSNLFDGESY
jgi:serine/threonine protein kinase